MQSCHFRRDRCRRHKAVTARRQRAVAAPGCAQQTLHWLRSKWEHSWRRFEPAGCGVLCMPAVHGGTPHSPTIMSMTHCDCRYNNCCHGSSVSSCCESAFTFPWLPRLLRPPLPPRQRRQRCCRRRGRMWSLLPATSERRVYCAEKVYARWGIPSGYISKSLRPMGGSNPRPHDNSFRSS